MILKAQNRDVVGKKVQTLRDQKMVPASVYGPGMETVNLVLNDKEFRVLFKDAGYSKLFDLEIEGGKTMKALLKEVQVDKLKSQLIHVSIYAVDMNKVITTSVPIHFDGISMAVKNNLGLLVTSMSNVMVSCLPEKLPNEIVVDISKLDNVGDTIFMKDVKLPEGVTVLSHTNDVVALIASPQKSIEEETPAATTAEGEAEPAEGEADAAAAVPAEEAAK